MATLDNKLAKARAEIQRLRALLRRREKVDALAYDLLDWADAAGVIWLYCEKDEDGSPCADNRSINELGHAFERMARVVNWRPRDAADGA